LLVTSVFGPHGQLAGVLQPFYLFTFIHTVPGKIRLEPKLIHKTGILYHPYKLKKKDTPL
ncbi:MAG: hypothetical protein KBS83_04400, partial [Lachnospiraceae bacterium]|nr:hypothetical protein [Candidatus Equihabitans merdae]